MPILVAAMRRFLMLYSTALLVWFFEPVNFVQQYAKSPPVNHSEEAQLRSLRDISFAKVRLGGGYPVVVPLHPRLKVKTPGASFIISVAF